MAQYLDVKEIRQQATELRAAFDDLLTRPRVALRPRSRQWLFLRLCLETLLGKRGVQCSFTRAQATQYKFEVEERLRRFYLGAGRSVPFVFTLMDRQRASALQLVPDNYPSLLGYVLLVGHARPEFVPRAERAELRDYLPSVIDAAAHAEFAVYKRLPQIDLSPLAACFVVDGPAYQRIKNITEEHHQDGKTLAEPSYNPSTMRVLSVKLVELSSSTAFIRTKEYWYLRWWSLPKNRYVYVYNQTSSQRYFLVRRAGKWLVEANAYPSPRSTTPLRNPKL